MSTETEARLFAALKGITRWAAVRLEADKLIVPFDPLAGEAYFAPEGMKENDRCWVAKSPHVFGIAGLGATPAAAIADFIREVTGDVP